MARKHRDDRLAHKRASAQARRQLLFGRSDELDRHLAGFRSTLIDSINKGLLVIAAIALPASLLRGVYTGWMWLYGAQIAIALAAIALFVLRDRLSERFRAAAIMAVFWAVGLSALLVLGLAGAGLWWLVVSSLLMSLLYSIRAGMLVMLMVLAITGAVGTAFCLGVLPLPANAPAYLRSPAAWVSAAIGATVMPVIVFQVVAALNLSTLNLLRQATKQHELIRELATHDELTGVPTFTLALDRLEQALRAIPRSGRHVGLLFIDLDGFKAINDSLGHEAGDSVLASVARRLRLNLRGEDTVARVGGDEFLAILTGMKAPEEAMAVAAKLQRVLAEPIEYREHFVPVACSIGVAFASDHRYSAEDMIRAADAAMYQAKRAGGGHARMAPDPEPLQAMHAGPELTRLG